MIIDTDVETTKRVKEALDWDLDEYVDATDKTFISVGTEYTNLYDQILNRYDIEEKKILKLAEIVCGYILWLVWAHERNWAGGYRHSPIGHSYDDVDVRIGKAELLLRLLEGIWTLYDICECKQRILNAKRLDFRFNYIDHPLVKKYIEGHAINVPLHQSIELYFSYLFSSIRQNKHIFIRVGQKEPETALFQMELSQDLQEVNLALHFCEGDNRQLI